MKWAPDYNLIYTKTCSTIWHVLVTITGSTTQVPCQYHQVTASHINTLRPRQNGRHFADYIFKWIFLNENVRISIKISLKFVPKGPINNIPALVQIMAWHRPGDKPLSEPMMVSLLTHICVTRPQWVKGWAFGDKPMGTQPFNELQSLD